MNKIVLVLILGVAAFASCDCSNSVSTNYEKITMAVPSHFTGIEKKLEDVFSELEKTIEQKEQEIKLIEKAIENKNSLVVLNEQEVSQLEKMHAYVLNQNDVKIIGTKTDISKTQNSILDNSSENEKDSQNPFWKNK